MSSPVVPGPLTRLLRNRFASVGVVTLAVFAAGTGYMGDVAAVQLQGTVDANWRGAFDLLVRPSGQRLNIEETAGLVEPNYLTFTGEGGITLDEWTAIGAVPGVEVAAPVAMIGNMRYVVGGPVVARGDLPEQPTLYRLTVRAETSDGVADVLIQEETTQILIGPAEGSSESMPFVTDADSVSYGADGLYLYLGTLPAIASPIIGVDPEAERQLLGTTADFLMPLQELAELPSQPAARDFDIARIPESFADQSFLLTLLTADPGSPAAQRPVIPVAVSATIYAPLSVTLEVEQIGQPLAEFPTGASDGERLQAAAELAGPGTSDAGSFVLDASAALRPFQPPRLMVEWPGVEAPSGTSSSVGIATDLTAELAGRPHYAAVAARDGSAGLAFGVTSVDWVDSSGRRQQLDAAAAGAVRVGVQPAFRQSRPAPLPLLDEFVSTGDLDRPFVFAPVAEFDIDRLDLPDNPLNYVPLGAYSAPEAWYVAGADGEAVEPVRMTPTLNPLGLITLPPLAITDLRSAETLRGGAPIDVIRVRVAGIDRFDEAALRNVSRIASVIESMGFEVDIVAGSSPQPVELLVAEQGTGGSTSRELGWVEQPWTTLGAAERVVYGFGSTNTALLLLSGLTTLSFAAGMLVLQRSVRTLEVGVLRALGWSRWRVVRWMLGEAAWAGAIVLAVGLVAWWLAGGTSGVGLAASATLAVVFPGVAAAGAWTGLRSAGAPSGIRSGDVDISSARLVRLVRDPSSYGLRAAAARPSRIVVISLALGIAAGAAVAGVAAVASTAVAVGPTRLAQALTQLLGPMQTAILLAAIGASALLGITLLRMDLRSRGEELRVLSACGWDRHNKRVMLTAHRLVIGAPAAAVAAALGWLLTAAVLGAANPVLVGIGPMVVIAVLLLETRWAT